MQKLGRCRKVLQLKVKNYVSYFLLYIVLVKVTPKNASGQAKFAKVVPLA